MFLNFSILSDFISKTVVPSLKMLELFDIQVLVLTLTVGFYANLSLKIVFLRLVLLALFAVLDLYI